MGCPLGSGCGLLQESNQNKINDDLSFSTKFEGCSPKTVGPALIALSYHIAQQRILKNLSIVCVGVEKTV